MRTSCFLLVSTCVELGAGLALLLIPTIPIELLLGIGAPAPETTTVGRVAGAALLSIGVICWLGRGSHTQRGPLIGLLLYDVIVAALLAYAALGLKMTGVALWPAVVLHTALAGWSMLCLQKIRGGPLQHEEAT